jgi:predicted Zn-dependent protease
MAGRGATLVALLLLSSCQMTNVMVDPSLKPSDTPVTVDNVTRGDRLAEIARQQHPKILATYGGEYSDPKVERMVARIVGRLTAVSANPGQTYKITLLDSPNVNAFALPGGYLYITRGLLALADDSSELAAVIAHEMGHVTANHGLKRQEIEERSALAAKVVSDVLEDDPDTRAALVRGKLKLAQFSRNQELEADAIGIKATGDAGYDPYAAARFLRSMDGFAALRSVSGADDASLDFLATHPNTPQRIQLADNHARNFGPAGSAGERDQGAYLAGIDGLPFGDSPDEGYVRGRRFLHPGLGVGFSVPAGFAFDNSAAAVTAAGPGNVAVRFDGVELSPATALTDYVQSGWVTGLVASTVRPVTVNGLEAVRARAVSGEWQFDIAVVRIGGQAYRLLTAAPRTATSLATTADSIVSSFKRLTPDEIAALKPLAIRIIAVKPGDTVGTLAARMSGVDRQLELFRILNGLSSTASLSAGMKVKIVSDR